MSQSQGEAAIRRAGAGVALAAASALMATMGFPAVEARADVVLALHGILQLGCAAVLLSLSPAHGAVSDLARRATEAGRATVLTVSARAPAVGLLRWLGFAGIALYVASDVAARNKAAAEAEAASLETVKDFLLFLMFLAGVWAIYLSMVRGRAAPPPRSSAVAVAPAAAEEDPDGGEVNAMAPARVVVDSKL